MLRAVLEVQVRRRMFYDGQNLEAENEEEANKLLGAIRALGDVSATENADSHTVKVGSYSFILQQGNSSWITMTGLDDGSDEKLYDLYLACGGEPEEDE